MALLVLGMALSATVAAQGLASLMKGTAAELFEQQDTDLLLEAARQALVGPADGPPVAWSNPATNHRGDVAVAKRFESRGRPCKELRFRNEAGNRKGEGSVNACHIDGRWRLLGDSQLD